MKKIRTAVFCLGVVAATVSSLIMSGISVSARSNEEYPVSPALCVIAEDSGMAMAGLVGSAVDFEREDFARALNVSEVGSITITQAPAVSDGELRVGSMVVTSGQSISAPNLSLLSYTPSREGVSMATFRFSPEGCGYDIPCSVYLLDKANYAPTLSDVPENYLDVSTHRNITLYGTLPCYDADGDTTMIEIVSYPEEGLLELTDKYTGEYKYTPASGYSGKDSFVYVARDMYGNYSASKTVSLTVSKPTVSVKYGDLDDSPYYNAALTMAEAGIMSGSQVGSQMYFYPDATVSRGDFLIMAMHSIGIKDVADVSVTQFADDEDIPMHMKGYVSVAYDLGYIKGVETDRGRCFEANRSITRAEAAVMLKNMLSVSTPTYIPTFNDASDIPAWASPAVYSLNHIGVMRAYDGNISSTAELCRGDAAQILANVIDYVN